MGRAHGKCGEGERYIRGFGGGNVRERDNLEDLSVDGVIILRCIVYVVRLDTQCSFMVGFIHNIC
jgi:hypothetical protein